MTLIWNICHFLRIIPRPGSNPPDNCISKIALIMWLMLILTVGGYMSFYNLYCNGELCTFSSYSQMVTFLLSDVLILLQSLLLIKELSSLTDLSTDLNTFPMPPKYSRFCLLLTMLHGTSFIIEYSEILLYEEDMYDIEYLFYFVALGILYLLNFLLMSVARIVIGVTVNTLCKSLEDRLSTLSMANIELTIAPIVLEYRMLKTKLSFLLFGMFTVDVIMLISYAYFISKQMSYELSPYLLYRILHLSYIAIVLDDCYTALKSALPTCR